MIDNWGYVNPSGPATDDEMIAALNEYGPLSIAIYVNNNFFFLT